MTKTELINGEKDLCGGSSHEAVENFAVVVLSDLLVAMMKTGKHVLES